MLVSKQLKKGGKEGCRSRVLPKEANLRTSIYESGNRLTEMTEAFTMNLCSFNCSNIRLGIAMRKVRCKENSCNYGGKASQRVPWVHPCVMYKVYISVSSLMQCTPYLTKTAFFHHVFPDVVPDATFGQQAASSGLFKFFIASIFLQCPLHNINGL